MVALAKRFSSSTRSKIWKSREWADYVKTCVSHYRSHSLSRALNHHDWDDIAQICLIHIWKKRAHYNPAMPLKPWLKVITLYQVQNAIRNRLHHPQKGAGLYRFYLRNPQSIAIKCRNCPDSRCEEVVYEPDAIDPRTTYDEMTLDELPSLNRDQKMTIHLLTGQKSVAAAARQLNGGKRLKRGTSVQQKLYKQRAALRKVYAEALNNPK